MSKQRTHFADHEDDIWAELWEILGGVYLNPEGWRQDKLKVTHSDWMVMLDFHTHGGHRSHATYTRFRSAFDNSEGFHFTVEHQGLVDSLFNLIGLPDVEVGDEEFDKLFHVKSNDAPRVRALLTDNQLRQLLLEEPKLFLQLRDMKEPPDDGIPDAAGEVVMEVRGKVTDPERLKRLYMTFARALARLCESGAAYPTKGMS